MIRKEHPYRRLLTYLVPIGLLVFLTTTRLYTLPLTWMTTLTRDVIYAAQDGTFVVVTGVRNLFARYFFLVGLHDENKHLKQEVEQLQGEIYRLKEEEIKAKHLRRLLRFTRESPHPLIAAEVIGRGAGPSSATLIINKGTAHGVKGNAGVIVPRGVVGKIITVSSHHAQVLLMTDPRSAIAAIVQKTREEGIVRGMGEGKAQLKYLPPLGKAAVGDALITSGLEGSFPKGIRLGQIEKIEVPKNDFFLQIAVIPEVSLLNVEEVLVIGPLEKDQPASLSESPTENKTP